MKINQSKLTIPDYSPCLHRNRLHLFLEQNIHRSLITITSEAGYGKTTLVSSFINKKQIPSLWYQLDITDQNPYTFLSYLKVGLQPFLTKLNLNITINGENPEQEITEISSILTDYPEPLIIVLDNFHCLNDQEELKSWILHLVKTSSPSITFILLSRVKLELPLVQFKIKQQLAELKTKDLAFNQQEILDYIKLFIDFQLSSDEITFILHKTEGWITGIVLLVDAILQLNEGERKSFITHFSLTDDLHSYFASEIYLQQPRHLQQFLIHSCLMLELDPNVIKEYLDVKDVSDTLDHLLNEHLFISKAQNGCYRYHYLFRLFLYRQLKKEVRDTDLQAMHVHLAKIYETHHSLLQSFAHYTWAKDYNQATRLMRIMIKRFQPILFMTVVNGLLEAFNLEHSLSHTSLFIFRCVPVSVLDELISIFEQNIACIPINNNHNQAHLQHRLGSIYFYKGNLHHSLKLFESSLEEALASRDFGLAALNYSMISQVYRFLGEEQKAISNVREALSYTEKYPIAPHVKMHALWNLAEVCILQNDLTNAEILLKESIMLSDYCDEASKTYPYSSMGKIYRLLGRFKESIEWGKRAIEHAIRFQIDTDLGWAYLELGITYFFANKIDLAEKSLYKAQQHFVLYSHIFEIAKDWMDKIKNHKQRDNIKTIISDVEEPQLLTIKLFGNLEIKKGIHPVNIPRKSSLRLFLLLVIHRGKKVTRDYLLETLFPEDSVNTGQNKFYVSLSILRKALEPNLKSGKKSTFIRQQGEHIFLSTEHISVDIDAFLNLATYDVSISSLSIEELLKLESLYENDLLDEFPYESFLENEREKLCNYYLEVLEMLGEYYISQNDDEKSIQYYEKILHKDPFREPIYVRLLEILLRSQYYSKVKFLYNKANKHLNEDLGLDVDALFQPQFKKYHHLSIQQFVRNGV